MLVATSTLFLLACCIALGLAALYFGPAILFWPGRAVRAVLSLPGRLLGHMEDWVTARRQRRLALRQAELNLAKQEQELYERRTRTPVE